MKRDDGPWRQDVLFDRVTDISVATDSETAACAASLKRDKGDTITHGAHVPLPTSDGGRNRSGMVGTPLNTRVSCAERPTPVKLPYEPCHERHTRVIDAFPEISNEGQLKIGARPTMLLPACAPREASASESVVLAATCGMCL